MLKEYSNAFEDGQNIMELVITLLSYYLCLLIYRQKGAINQHSMNFYLLLLMSVILIWGLLQRVFVHRGSKRFLHCWNEVWTQAKINLLGLMVLLVGFFIWDPGGLHNRFVLYFVAINFTLLSVERVSIKVFLNSIRRRGYNFRMEVLVGWNHRAKAYVERVNDNPHLGYRIIGYVDESLVEDSSIEYLGSLDNLEDIINHNIVDKVVVSLPLQDERVQLLIGILQNMGKDWALVLDDSIESIVNRQILNFKGLTLLNYASSPSDNVQLMLKRTLDIIGSLTSIIIFSPVMFVTALLIKCTSPGPVIFKQLRVGLNGRQFQCYKFRSMVLNAEQLKSSLAKFNEMSGPVFKIKNDPRITPIGGVIRKTSIDELPQLFNVLKGDMSLVGPRPPLPSEVEEYETFHRRRLSVKPGITCLWQISGRNNVDFEQWMKMDADYITNWSLWLDLKILFQTLPVVLMRKGAS